MHKWQVEGAGQLLHRTFQVLTIDRNEVFELHYDLRHRRSFHGILRPHVFSEIDYLWTPLLL